MPPGFTSAAFIVERLVADSCATAIKAASFPSVTAAPPHLQVLELNTVGGLPVQVLFSFRSAIVCCGGWSSLSISHSGAPFLDSDHCPGYGLSPTPGSSGPSASSTLLSGCYVVGGISVVIAMLTSRLGCGIRLPVLLLHLDAAAWSPSP